jgi:poly(A) polymerase
MTLKLDPDKISWLGWPETKAVMAALQDPDAPNPPHFGPNARFVGGCVRDGLLGQLVEDIDIACKLAPEVTTGRLVAAGIKVVPTGIDHGTVTAVAGGHAFEITTLRHDVESFGRHARVKFTDDWEVDAARRDFTINALYANADGTIFDPLGGANDLTAGIVKFIGAAEERITEDALRILRFFRFHAWYGRGDMNAAGLAACVQLIPLLDILSAERVTKEILKLVAAPQPAATVRKMLEAGILQHILGQAENTDRLDRLEKIDGALGKIDPLRRLAALLPPSELNASAALRLSNGQQKRLLSLALPLPEASPLMEGPRLTEALYRLGRGFLVDHLLLNWAASFAPANDESWRSFLAYIEDTPIPCFPLKGADVVARGIAPGPKVGQILARAEKLWIKGGFPPDRNAALEFLDQAQNSKA